MKDEVLMPASKQKTALADILKKEGYIADFTIAPNPSGPAQIMKIDLKYSDDRKRTISGIKRVSTPGLRVYRAATDVPRVLGGLGVAVLSTSQGLMTDREARKRNVGGEVMCFVW
jgi:small subunit ribosomal protein S8